MNSDLSDAILRCDHANAPFEVPPVPDDSPRCPDCGERVAYHAGAVFTRRELNERGGVERELFEEAQRCIREGDRDGLIALANRNVDVRAEAAARAIRRGRSSR